MEQLAPLPYAYDALEPYGRALQGVLKGRFINNGELDGFQAPDRGRPWHIVKKGHFSDDAPLFNAGQFHLAFGGILVHPNAAFLNDEQLPAFCPFFKNDLSRLVRLNDHLLGAAAFKFC